MKKYCKNENVLVKLFFIQQGCTKYKKAVILLYLLCIQRHTHACIYLRKICYVYILN